MTSEERRKQIEEILSNNLDPVTASYLAKEFSVSRQVIVGDIAIMRAGGIKITATPRGYVLEREADNQVVFTVACCHDKKTLGEELYAIVDNGGLVRDVTVEHPIYGEIVGELQIGSRYDVDLFLKKVADNKVQPLSKLTDGIHLHTIKCKDAETKKRIINVLKAKNILLDQE
ncbi:MAG: transcription repressor NadR [Bacillota bacterium]|jgi:transcriptional regulator of NAD metabolism|nr:transcription repressor NadR [Bacillota bacterium]NLL59680.1 transcription repressor NadR [Tissierellia bacterium]